jgi:hypothetical protein
VLEACVEMRLEAKIDDDGIMVAVDVCIYAIETLEDL